MLNRINCAKPVMLMRGFLNGVGKCQIEPYAMCHGTLFFNPRSELALNQKLLPEIGISPSFLGPVHETARNLKLRETSCLNKIPRRDFFEWGENDK